MRSGTQAISRAAAALTAERWLLAIMVLLLPIRELSPVVSSVLSLGVLLAVPFLFVPLSRVTRYRSGGLLVGVWVAALLAAPVLWLLSDGRPIVWDEAWIVMLTLLVALIHFMVLLWAREKLGTLRTVALYAAGMVAQVMLALDRTEGNPWKFGLAVPVTFLLLALTANRHPTWTVIALVTVGLVSVNTDFRSFVAIVVVVLVMWIWNRRSSARAVAKMIGLVAVAAFAYVAGTQAALAGWLGERNRIVTEAQIAASGSVLAGGRVESAASFAIFAERPIGIGPGVRPAASDIAVGRQALYGRGVNVDGDYVTDYVFDGSVKLHSIAADLWLNYGLVALVLAALMLWVAISAGLAAFASRQSPALVIFAIVLVAWNLAFSPIGTNFWETVLALSLLIPMKSAYQDQPAAPAYTSIPKNKTPAITTVAVSARDSGGRLAAR